MIDWVFNVGRTFEDFSGFDLHLRSIIYVIFKIVLYNFVYNISSCMSDKHTSWTLANMVRKIFKIFFHFWGQLMVFPHRQVMILQILILFPFKSYKHHQSSLKRFKMHSISYVAGFFFVLHRLIKIFLGNRALKVS